MSSRLSEHLQIPPLVPLGPPKNTVGNPSRWTDPRARADELRAGRDVSWRRGRGVAKLAREKSSIWTTRPARWWRRRRVHRHPSGSSTRGPCIGSWPPSVSRTCTTLVAWAVHHASHHGYAARWVRSGSRAGGDAAEKLCSRRRCASLGQAMRHARWRRARACRTSERQNRRAHKPLVHARSTRWRARRPRRCGRRRKENERKAKQAVLLHASSMFDANECSLNWFTDHENLRQYVELLVDVIGAELPDILSDEFEINGQYSANFM